MSTTAAVIKDLPSEPARRRRLDLSMFAGIAIAAAALLAGIAATGVRMTYFFQPTGALIVFGGTLGAMFITTPRTALIQAMNKAIGLFSTPEIDYAALAEEIMTFVKHARANGLLAVETMIEGVRDPFLKESLALAIDVQQRADLEDALNSKMRLGERQGENDARVLEVAGGFAPTIGVLGTVVGLIDVLRQFSDLSSVAAGIGTAFVSTIYGLGLANLVLLPLAFRIRARTAENFEQHELITEGILCLYDRVHPSLVRERLDSHLRQA
ncbi:MAG TPA: MotA/TolQ/ExbB proton channel family protein [Bryobacteraceae bacterium]|nr:MotA/TolQ/ExbB proton channel family protein [Bryobacteraceae bacterium]